MVREGHDSTVRPTVQTYEFSGGRAYLDSWSSDGKPNLSRRFIAWSRVGNVALCTCMAAVLIFAEEAVGQHTIVVVVADAITVISRRVGVVCGHGQS